MKFNSTALARAAIGVIWLIVGLTIAAEKSAPFKASLAQLGGHHWVGKGILSVVFFTALYLLFRKSRESDTILRNIFLVWGSVVAGGLAIFLFYVNHFLAA